MIKLCAIMDHIDEPFESSSNIRDEKVDAAEDLLEECWFFGNLLDRKTKSLLRCYCDPCPSSIYGQEMLVKNSSGKKSSSSSIKKLSQGDGFVRPDLIRTPSLPCCVLRDGGSEEKESDFKGMRKPTPQAPLSRSESFGDGGKMRCQQSQHNLLRTPSLPPCIGREEDEESEFSMSKLIRQASLKYPSDVLPPRHTSKGTKQSSSRHHHPGKNPELESVNMEACNEMRYQTKMKKSMNDLESKQLQGFKDLGFKFDKKDLKPSVVNIIPGLQEKNRACFDEDKAWKPYLSESWMVHSSSPPIPNWFDKKNSSREDMKAQIKFWARSVAANVR
ncbi:unnamed protein product [Camellia sinensis]